MVILSGGASTYKQVIKGSTSPSGFEETVVYCSLVPLKLNKVHTNIRKTNIQGFRKLLTEHIACLSLLRD